MPAQLAIFLSEQYWMRVLRAIHVSGKPCSVRELVDLCGMSPAGVQDVLRRLEAAGIIEKRQRGNKVLHQLALDKSEQHLIKKLIQTGIVAERRARAEKFSLRSQTALSWIDETLESITEAKAKLRLAKVQKPRSSK